MRARILAPASRLTIQCEILLRFFARDVRNTFHRCCSLCSRSYAPAMHSSVFERTHGCVSIGAVNFTRRMMNRGNRLRDARWPDSTATSRYTVHMGIILYIGILFLSLAYIDTLSVSLSLSLSLVCTHIDTSPSRVSHNRDNCTFGRTQRENPRSKFVCK